MRILYVRGVPENLYRSLRELAQEQRRSLSAEVIALLECALADERRRRQQVALLAEIRSRQFTPPAGATETVELLREDRDR